MYGDNKKLQNMGSLLGTGLDATRSAKMSNGRSADPLDLADPIYWVADGRESSVGNALNDAGKSVFTSSAEKGNLWGMLAGAALKIGGGIVNAGWGHTEDKEGINRINNFSDRMSMLRLDNSNNDVLQSQLGNLSMTTGALNRRKFKDGWFNHDGTRAYNTAMNTRAVAIGRGMATVDNAVLAAAINNNQLLLANYSAFGGLLGTNGADFSNGLTMVESGGTHEQNPFEGVMMGVDQQGVPNMVEEGEVIWNDYVFSNRLKVPKKMRSKYKLGDNITFADAAKKLSKESEERPNDPISQAGLQDFMQSLMQDLEQVRELKRLRELQRQLAAMPEEERDNLLQQMAMQLQGGYEEMPMAMSAFGGPINKFEHGSLMNQMFSANPRAYLANLLRFKTQKEWDNYIKAWQDSTEDAPLWASNLDEMAEIFKGNPKGINYAPSLSYFANLAEKRGNQALAHAINSGYNPFYSPTYSLPNQLTFDFKHGAWGAELWGHWEGSTDAAYLEAMKTLGPDFDRNSITVADALKATKAYQSGTDWLKNSEENRRQYMKAVLDSPDAPEDAKNWVRLFLDHKGRWKAGVDRSYASTMQKVREENPGTFWKTPIEMLSHDIRNSNYLIDDDGYITELFGDVPTKDFKLDSSYNWIDDDALTNNTVRYYRAKKTPGKEYYTRTWNGDTPLTALIEDYGDEWLKNNPGWKVQSTETGEDGTLKYYLELDSSSDVPLFDNWMRYAPIAGAAIGLGMSLEKPDESSANAIAEATEKGNSLFKPVGFNPIGDYLTYRPLDIDMTLNPLLAESAASRRNIQNVSGGNRGAAMAGMLASDYNAFNAIGAARQQVAAANRAHEKEVAEFNRATNQYNSEGQLKADMANQSMFGSLADFNLRGTMEAEKLRQNVKLAREQAISANLTNLFNSIGGIGEQKVADKYAAWLGNAGAFGLLPEDNTKRKSRRGGKI